MSVGSNEELRGLSKEYLGSIGRGIESLRLNYLALQQVNEDIALNEELECDPDGYPELRNVHVSWDEGVLKISVSDYPATVKMSQGNPKERERWLRGIIAGIEGSGLNVSFKTCFIMIKIVLPASYRWDPDNRSLKPIFDALRYVKLIKDDTWDNVGGFAVIPGVDRENPRTEIHVFEIGGLLFEENLVGRILSYK